MEISKNASVVLVSELIRKIKKKKGGGRKYNFLKTSWGGNSINYLA